MSGLSKADIIRIAREADLLTITEPNGYQVWIPENLERFVALVYVEAHKDGLDDFEAVVLPAAIKAEREACARVCDEQEQRSRESSEKSKRERDRFMYHHCAITAKWNAAAIRARGSDAA